MSGVMGDKVTFTSLEVKDGMTYTGEVGTSTVTTAVEFPDVKLLDTGSIAPGGGGDIGGSVDVHTDDVVRTFSPTVEGHHLLDEAFNGETFDFAGRSTPEIIGASIKSTNISGLDDSKALFNSTGIGYNGAGLTLPSNQVAYVDISIDFCADVSVTTLSNGHHVIVGDGDGLALLSSQNDKMTGGGQNDAFVFARGCGHEDVTDFIASGAGHDVLNLSACGFNSISQVLQHTTMQNGSAVIHIDGQNTIKLDNVAKSDLLRNESSIYI